MLEYPISICDHDGKPLKGQKSYTTNSLEARYKSTQPPVFITELPTGQRPQCSLIEGIFLINTTPLGSHKTISDYAKFLLKRYIISQFNRGSQEVQVIFDNPGHLANTPKYFERQRRDAIATVSLGHCCDEVTANTKIPSRKWRENFLNCRQCKQSQSDLLAHISLTILALTLSPSRYCMQQEHLMGQRQIQLGSSGETTTNSQTQLFTAMPRKRTPGYGCMPERPTVLMF